MVLIVFFSSRISPRTSTVILRERSPRATAVVTSAMLRTWPVRFDAMKFTLSVRSFQVPATPGTCAWPPSAPSVPTSRATRVTSEAKPLSWSTIVLIVFLRAKISPFTSTVILRLRSPLATAVVTSAILRTCAVRFDAIELTESVRSFHVPATPGTAAWPPSAPSVPTSRATRVTSEENPLSWSTIVLMVSLSSRISPFTSTVIFRERSPRATAVVTAAMLRTCAVRFDAIALTESVRSFQVPPAPGTTAWPPSRPSVPTSRATRVTSDANDLSWYHGVDRFLELEDLTAHVHGDFLGQVAVGNGDRHLGDVAHLRCEVAGHPVHRFREVLPHARHACHLRLAAELAFGADLTRHARHLRSKNRELFDHGIDQLRRAQELTLERSSVHLQLHGLAEVSLRHRADGPGAVDGRPHQVVDECVDRIGLHRPIADGSGQRHALLETAFLAHRRAQPPHFTRDDLLTNNRLIEGLGDSPLDAGPVRWQARGEISIAEGHDRLEDLTRARLNQLLRLSALRSHQIAISIVRSYG